MTIATISFAPFVGYYFKFGDKYNWLLGFGQLYFYNPNGKIVTFDISNGLGFKFKINTDKIALRRKENFSRNEVFGLTSKESGTSSYMVFIPIDAVEMEFLGHKSNCQDGYYITNWDEYALKVSDLTEYYKANPYLKCEDNKIIFKVITSIEENEKQNAVDALIEDIENICHVSILDFQMKKILKYYDIIKKG